jgi:hypothetical protein
VRRGKGEMSHEWAGTAKTRPPGMGRRGLSGDAPLAEHRGVVHLGFTCLRYFTEAQ